MYTRCKVKGPYVSMFTIGKKIYKDEMSDLN